MTFRRILIITIILLVLVGLLFGASWYVSRRTASRNGTTPLTFREFLGIGTPAAPGLPAQGEFVSQFTTDANADKNNNGVLDGEEDLNFNGSLDKNDIVLSAAGQKTDVFTAQIKNAITVSALAFSRFGDTNKNTINDWNEDVDGNGEIDGIQDKDQNGTIDGYDGGLVIGGNPNSGNNGGTDGNPNGGNNGGADGFPNDGGGFTNGTIMPSDTFGGAGGNPSSGTGATPGGPLPDNGTAVPPPLPGQNTAVTDNSCSVADTNIEFTAAEIARLNTLQARFDGIAATLYDDASTEQQNSFYSSFKIKEQQTAELVNFCRAKAPLITDPKMNIQVPTPFYHENSQDNNTFTNNAIVTSDYSNNSSQYRPLLNFPITATTLFERLLRINIW